MIEDNPADAKYLRRCLGKAFKTPCEVIVCATAEAGRQALAGGDIDCLLLDYLLGAVSGLDVLSEIRGAGNDVPIIAVTGMGDETVAVESMKRGAQDYLVKDRITSESLHRAVSNAIQKVTLERKLAEKQLELEQFVSIASHGLRTPLHNISRFAESVKQHCRGKVDREVDRDVDFIVSGANQMRQLLETLLEYSLAGHSEKALESVNLGKVIESALANLQSVVEGANARVEVAPMPNVLGDEAALTRLVLHLIANAINFRGKAPPVVTVSAHREGNTWTVSVGDNGIGFDPAHQEEIFVPFRRPHAEGEYEGSGVGLATCRRIIDQHHGRIWAESEPGKGSTFHFTLLDESARQSELADEEVGKSAPATG